MILGNVPISQARSRMRDFSRSAESSKVFIRLSSEGELFGAPISVSDAKDLCYRSGNTLSCDNETLLEEFEYTRYKNGMGEKDTIRYPSCKYIKNVFECLAEEGYMGIGIDTDSSPISNLVMFNYCFARADFGYPRIVG